MYGLGEYSRERIDHNRQMRPERRCFRCCRKLSDFETKVVLPSSAFGAAELPVEARTACGRCYAVVARRSTLPRRQQHRFKVRAKTDSGKMRLVLAKN